MARFLSQTLIRSSLSSSSSITNPLKLGISQPNRFSSRSGNHQLHEIDVESSSSSDSEVTSKKLDDIIRTIIVKESAPDWIDFVPGSSYWVPPFRNNKLSEAINNVTTNLDQLLAVSCFSSRGYPSSDYFIQGTFLVHPVGVNADKNRENVLQSEDEEG